MARPKKNTAPETTQATKMDTVMVALNRTTGITFPMPDGRKVLIEGNAASLRGKEKGVLPVGAFGLTRVNADDWAYIEKTYGPHMEIFKSGLIFAQGRRRGRGRRKGGTAQRAGARGCGERPQGADRTAPEQGGVLTRGCCCL